MTLVALTDAQLDAIVIALHSQLDGRTSPEDESAIEDALAVLAGAPDAAHRPSRTVAIAADAA